MLAWASFGALWELGHKVTFDGENKLVIVDPSVEVLNVRQDLYSAWKEWAKVYDSAKWDAALRTTGGDPIGGGQFTGDYYFFINGWRMQIGHGMIVEGNIFSDDFDSAFITVDGAVLVQNRVSSLAILLSGGGGGGTGDCPTAAQIRQEIDANSTQLAQIVGTTNTINSTVNTINATTQTTNTTVNEIDNTVDMIHTVVSVIDTTTQDIQGTVNNIDTLISSGAFPTLGQITDAVWNAALVSYSTSGSAGYMVSAILNTVIDSNTKGDEVKTVVDSIIILVDEILKYDRNRTRIDKAARTLTVYDDDGTTPLRVFNLLDGTSTPSVTEVLERNPQ